MFNTHHDRRCRPCRFIVAGWAVVLLAFVSSAAGKPLAPTPAFENASPFMLTVARSDGQPARQLNIRATVIVPGVHAPGELFPMFEFKNIESNSGTVELLLPDVCELNIHLFAPGNNQNWVGKQRVQVLTGEEREHRITLDPAPVVRGLVFDKATEAPIPGAHIRLLPFHSPGDDPYAFPARTAVTAVTDDAGRFVLNSPFPARTLSMRVHHPAYSSKLFGWYGHDSDPSEDGSPSMGVGLEPAQTHRGRVVDATGQPISNAVIRPSPKCEAVEVDSEGEFEITLIETLPRNHARITDKPRIDVEIEAPGYQARRLVALDEWNTGEIATIRLEQSLKRELRITDPLGNPVESVEVFVHRNHRMDAAAHLHRSVAIHQHETKDGWLTVDLGANAPAEFLGIRSDEYPLQWHNPPKETDQHGRTEPGWGITLHRGFDLLGRIRSEHGIPQDSIARLTVERWHTSTDQVESWPWSTTIDPCWLAGFDEASVVFESPIDESGSFRLNNLPKADFTLTVNAPGFSMDPMTITTHDLAPGDAREIPVLTIQPTGTLRGTLLDHESRPLPLKHGWISQEQDLPRCILPAPMPGEWLLFPGFATAQFTTDEHGQFEVAGLHPGTASVHIRGHQPGETNFSAFITAGTITTARFIIP